MTIASVAFLGFVLLVAGLYNLARPVWWRQGVLLLANAAFLASFAAGPVSMLPLLGFLGLGYGALRLAQRGLARPAYVSVLAGLLLLFCWLKHYGFLPAAGFLPFAYSVIGLSYMFFRVMHVVIDAADGALPQRIGPVAYCNYVLNFTSLVSGPIQRYQEYARTQLAPKRPVLDWVLAGRATERIALGLFKVVVLAAVLYGWHQRSLLGFAAQDSLIVRVEGALGAMVFYTLYLYCNFSGYTDIVIGAARFYRLELPENFDRPFSSTSFIDFWSRWHMTLSNWLKTYVYNTLMRALFARFPSRRSAPAITAAAFFFTFFLIGLWHGQTSVFAVYGVLLGMGVSVNKLYQIEMARRLGRKTYRTLAERGWYQALARGLTFTWFNLSLVFFWGTWPVIGGLITGLGGAGLLLLTAALLLGASVVLAAWVAARDACLLVRAFGTPVLLSRYTRTVWVTAAGALAGAALTLLAAPAPDIVYKTF